MNTDTAVAPRHGYVTDPDEPAARLWHTAHAALALSQRTRSPYGWGVVSGLIKAIAAVTGQPERIVSAQLRREHDPDTWHIVGGAV